jgi:hypothetical protein
MKNENEFEMDCADEYAYKNGYCYDCGEKNCEGINSLTGEKDH